jgi:hypothetical protein
MADLIETFFAGFTTVEEIPKEEIDASHQNYMALSERINVCNSTSMAKTEIEVIKTNIIAKKIQFITADIHMAPTTFMHDMSDVKAIEYHEINGESYECLIPINSKILNWKEGLTFYEAHLLNIFEDLSYCDCEVNHKIENVVNIVDTHDFTRMQQSNKNQFELRKLMLRCLILENILRKTLKELAQQCLKIKFVPDSITDGLWMHLDKREKTALQTGLPLSIKRSLRLSSKIVGLIVEVLFSISAYQKAKAKMDLVSLLNEATFDMLQTQPHKLLATAIVEAALTPDEALAILFPQNKDGDNYCKSCQSVVKFDIVIYHMYCQTTKWIIQNLPFMYDHQDRAIYPIHRAYIDSEAKSRLSRLLGLHNKLNNNIVIRDGTELLSWKRIDGKSMEKQKISVHEDDKIIGTHSWKIENGFISRK